MNTEPVSNNDLSNKVDEAWQYTKEGFATNVNNGKQFVRSNPQWSIIGTLAAGVALGFLLSRKNRPTVRQRYLEEPLHDLQSIAESLSAYASRQAERGGEAAAEAVESILDRIKSRLKL
jgi:ElaB/YqjD/DUF883 family membrane-anchored ribosome-binding protein